MLQTSLSIDHLDGIKQHTSNTKILSGARAWRTDSATTQECHHSHPTQYARQPLAQLRLSKKPSQVPKQKSPVACMSAHGHDTSQILAAYVLDLRSFPSKVGHGGAGHTMTSIHSRLIAARAELWERLASSVPPRWLLPPSTWAFLLFRMLDTMYNREKLLQ